MTSATVNSALEATSSPPMQAERRGSSRRPLWAVWFLIAGLIVGGIVVGTAGSDLLPQPGATRVLRVLWYIALFVLASGVAISARDIWWIWREWSAVSHLGSSLGRAKVIAMWPGSIVAGRIQAVDAAGAEQRVLREFRQTHRAQAAIRSGGVGTISRFLASALLVLAVMGTFAGMKTALPPLIQAITAAAGNLNLATANSPTASGQDASNGIGEALGHVADAFGANLAALFGSLLLGAAAFGAVLDKRALLAEIEHVSEERLYSRLPADADATELQRAVNEMRLSVSEVANVAGGISQLTATIHDLRSALSDTLTELHTSFSDSVRQNSVELGTQLNTAVSGLTANLAGATKTLEITSLSYVGLLKGLEERDLGVREAAAELVRNASDFRDISERLGECASVASDANERAAMAVDDAQKLLIQVAENGNAASERVAEAVTRQGVTLDQVVSALKSIQDWHGALRRQLAEVTQNLSRDLNASTEAAGASIDVLRDGIQKLSEAGETLGESIANEHQQGTALLAASIASAVAADGKNSEALLAAIEAHTRESGNDLAEIRSALKATKTSAQESSESIASAIAGIQGELVLLRREVVEAKRLWRGRGGENGKDSVA